MSVIILLILCSILVAGIFLGAFLWSVNHGQYEDTYSPSVRMLYDDELTTQNQQQQRKTSVPEQSKKGAG